MSDICRRALEVNSLLERWWEIERNLKIERMGVRKKRIRSLER
jgi:hypothetical protein